MSKGGRLAHLRRGVRQAKVGGARAERPGCVGIAGPLLRQRGSRNHVVPTAEAAGGPDSFLAAL